MEKVWLITGASRGLGRGFTTAVLERGDRVAATSRDPKTISDLVEKFGDRVLPIAMDTTGDNSVERAVKLTLDRFSRIDVLVNNAGFGTFGAVEELSVEQLRHQYDVNVLGSFRVTKAVLPSMRQQGAGRILQISSVSGVVTFPCQGAYASSKWAVEALFEVLAQEVRGFGIHVTLVEPGPFGTNLHGESSINTTPQPQYEPLRRGMKQMEGVIADVSGDVQAAGQAILKIADATEPPSRVFLGKSGLDYVPGVYEERVKTWRQWQAFSSMPGLGEAFPRR